MVFLLLMPQHTPTPYLPINMINNFFKLKITAIIIVLVSSNLAAQITISGIVKDTKTNEVLIGAYIFDSATKKVESTNVNGYFSISTANNCHLVFSYVGYEKTALQFNVKTDTIIEVLLTAGTKLSEVVVKGQKRQVFNTASLTLRELQQIPSLSGTPDVMKAMQLMPGIQPQSESSSMLIVRGGDPGQNLYLLDKTPLIYVNHLGGFMSVFNPEMINNITVLKGGFSAEYGGKLSSIVNITQRKGETSKIKGSFGIGITDINGLIEGSIGKKGTFIITGRKTLFGLLMYAASNMFDGNSSTIAYGFHDINAKLTLRLNHNNNLMLNAYQGDDYINQKSKKNDYYTVPKTHLNNTWGNWLVACSLNSIINPKLFAVTALSFTRYRYREKQKIEELGQYNFQDEFTSSVNDFNIRSTWNYHLLPWWKMNFGLISSFSQHAPYNYEITGVREQKVNTKVNAINTAMFFENKLKPYKTLTLIIGVRGINYNTAGFTDFSFEPRLQLTQQIASNHQVNLSYMQVNQYSHLLFTIGNIANNEVWIPVTKNIPPATTQQISAGWLANFYNNKYSTELSTYYKTLNNLSTYKQGEIDLKGDINWASKIESGGIGQSYGIELFVKKNYGKWTGNIGYSWSKTLRKYSRINKGKSYTYEYDRPHTLSTFVNRKLNDKWDFSFVWVYSTGLPYTPVVGRQYTSSLNLNSNPEPFYYEALIYGERNSGRMAVYHRLDISFKYTTQTKKGNKAIWNFSVYNLYNRQNPNYYYYNNNNTDEIHMPEMGNGFKAIDMYQISLFPILPSVSYKVYFDGKHKNASSIKWKERFRNLLYFND